VPSGITSSFLFLLLSWFCHFFVIKCWHSVFGMLNPGAQFSFHAVAILSSPEPCFCLSTRILTMATAVLNVKIDETLKEKLRHYAEVNNENLSITTEKLLLIAFDVAAEAGVSAGDIDSQHTEESPAEPLTPKEIKALRRLLKKKK
jgi:hypothetical protein